jgi:Ni,Fe-hydrogenase III large subunit/Ni,Fe-hydrogenase III component G
MESILSLLTFREEIELMSVTEIAQDEIYLHVKPEDFKRLCLFLHKELHSPIMMLFADDERQAAGKGFVIYSAFLAVKQRKWIFVKVNLPGGASELPKFDSLSKDIYSASLFEREIKEMFGIEPVGAPDVRRLRLHDEVWPEGHYPLRKDFVPPARTGEEKESYSFAKVDGEGVFEVPVGPVHAGIIGSGHFRFSVAGEPIINLETRLGFTHRGVEKLFEGRTAAEGIKIAECISGDSSFAHSLAFCQSIEKICGLAVSKRDQYLRAIFLELERLYNHINDIGGMAVDTGFTFPAALASVIKEAVLLLNDKLTGGRYLKGVNKAGGTFKDLSEMDKETLSQSLRLIKNDFNQLSAILNSSVSFMDRLDGTGILKKKTAEDFGVAGPAARASGVARDLRCDFPGVYEVAQFKLVTQSTGDVLARLKVRMMEFEESIRLIQQFVEMLPTEDSPLSLDINFKEGFGLGYAEGWRGCVLYWVKLAKGGLIERCKIVDPSFHNWQGLVYSVLGDIIPDFPLCNKSFDLSYSGNDL